ncbi:hypothetical protein ZYGM_004365 [Zygosaccharomyces mellis]|uniref:Oxidoreductase-like domain-containing protein n=1 Tax=Zygosaccharomyces mellis TaxID=42258 RepID=A0A4C2E8G7_9SACH|nr:hypothetical protein ZYGM_004365 [Zygosaccharomyces mellis]
MLSVKSITMQGIRFNYIGRRSLSVSPRLNMTFEGNKEGVAGTAEERMAYYFGAGRLRGEPPKSSSRRIKSETKVIGGVEVPSKPVEPDNCCMSGCINCVWELFNDDIREWRRKRKEAAQRIKDTEDIWPSDWNPPLPYLSLKNVPESLKTEKIHMDRQRKNQKQKNASIVDLFPQRKGPLPKTVQEAKKRNLQQREKGPVKQESAATSEGTNGEEPAFDDDDGWQNVPVYIRAFAEFERSKKLQRLRAQEHNQV